MASGLAKSVRTCARRADPPAGQTGKCLIYLCPHPVHNLTSCAPPYGVNTCIPVAAMPDRAAAPMCVTVTFNHFPDPS